MPDHDILRQIVIDHHLAVEDASRPDAVEYQHQRGKLTARERLNHLCDKDSFMEFGALALPEDSKKNRPSYADAVVTGLASVEGQDAIVASADFTVNGGSNGEVGLEKMRRCYQRAIDNGLPAVQLLEGVGHRISEGLDSRLFAPGFDSLGLQAQMSGWVPTPTAILGQGYAAMTLIAAMSDFVVMVRGLSAVGIAPPPLVKAAVGEDVDNEQLGGADLQAGKNGVADYVVDFEEDAFDIIKKYLSYFPANSSLPAPVVKGKPADPEFAENLDAIVPTDMRYAYDVRHVIKGIIDQDSFLEIKATYAKNMICGLTRIDGHPVGIVANQPNFMAGSLDSPACEKAAHFINLCDAFGIPLLFLLDLPGFLVGTEAERSKLARRSAKLIYEIARTTVPTYNIVLRKAYGGAYMAMNGGRTFGAELSLAWPTAEFAAMNVETATAVAYKKQISKADDPEAEHQKIIDKTKPLLGPIRAAEGFGIDDVILPEKTREILSRSLKSVAKRKKLKVTTGRTRGIAPI